MSKTPPRRIRLNIRENAYSFLNESLRRAAEAETRPAAWKFAVLHVVLAIELLLKARLQSEHPVLIYENVDQRRNTVSLAQAVERITATTGIALTPREHRSIRRARTWRDTILHFEFNANEHEVRSVYAQLFEFLMRFHDDHTDFGSLHDHIERDLWAQEAELIEIFGSEHVTYRGVELWKGWPAEIVKAQDEPQIELHGRTFDRIRYGNEPGWRGRVPPTGCGDCGVIEGEVHVMSCDIEFCPRCLGQLISCGCLWGEGRPDDELLTREAWEAALPPLESS